MMRFRIDESTAFAEFATRVEQLEDWVDIASEATLELYRASFRSFVCELMSDAKCYVRQDRPSCESVILLTGRAQAFKISLAISESCAATVFIPQHALALIGHDEFGCHLMFPKSWLALLSWVKTHATRAGLFVLRHPKPGAILADACFGTSATHIVNQRTMPGSRKNVLFICSRNLWRSPTAEQIFRKHPLMSVRSAGTSPNARRKVSADDIHRANVIFVMEQKHKSRLVAEFSRMLAGKAIHVLDIPDEYKYMDPELVEQLELTVSAILGSDSKR